MADTVIRADFLSKEYRIGELKPSGYLRDAIAALFSRQRRTQTGTIWALNDLSFEVSRGEIVGVIGRNGAGKTTLLRILSRITEPTYGSAFVRGRVASLLEIGSGFHAELTGRENIYFSGALLGMRAAEIRKRFDEIVAFSELEQFIDTPVKRYSFGMYTRLAFAVAAHLEAEVLLVDEVLAVGDSIFQKKCLGTLDSFGHSGRTVVFVTHQLNLIRRLCNKVMWIEHGRLQQIGSTLEVLSAYESAMLALGSKRLPGRELLNRQGTILSWGLQGVPQAEANILRSHGPVTVTFHLRLHVPLTDGGSELFLFNSDGQLLWGVMNRNLKLEPGTYQLRYELPFLPLKPGVYYWRIEVYNSYEFYVDICDCVPPLLVQTENSGHPRDDASGIVNIPYSLKIVSSSPG